MKTHKTHHLLLTSLLLAVYFCFTVHTVRTAPANVAEFLFSEAGTYEVFSSRLWLLLALPCCLASPLKPQTRIATATAALLLSAREMDMHKTLFDMSFIKSRFYVGSDTPLADKLIGALLLLGMAALLIYLTRLFLQHLRTHGLREQSTSLILTMLLLGGLSKVLDRLNSQLRELFHIHMATDTSLMVSALEESMEMLLPLLLITALLLAKRPHPH